MPVSGFFFPRACGYYPVSLKFLHAQCLPDVCHCGSMPRVNRDGMRVPGGDMRGPCWEPALQSA